MDEQVPQVARFPFREQARKHLKSAEELLCGEGQQLVYACLELRLAIEAIVYETLQAYEKNLSPDVAEAHQHWQPNKVLERTRPTRRYVASGSGPRRWREWRPRRWPPTLRWN